MSTADPIRAKRSSAPNAKGERNRRNAPVIGGGAPVGIIIVSFPDASMVDSSCGSEGASDEAAKAAVFSVTGICGDTKGINGGIGVVLGAPIR
jgi:hypothetical protein